MKKNIFIESNISQALDYIIHSHDHDNDHCNYFYLISSNSKGEKKRNEENNYNFLKTKVSKIKKITAEESLTYCDDDNYYFGNNAYREVKLVTKLKAFHGKQNRLLDTFDTGKISSFTPFKKLVEPTLPERYQDNSYQPDDPEVIAELKYYFEETHLAKEYFEIRNGVLGRDYSTKFSPYLASGRLNVRYLYNYLKDYEDQFGANKSTYWIQFEILWREFFYWSYQKHQNLYFSKNGIQGKHDFTLEKLEIDYSHIFKDDPFMLSVLSELKKTGFISNRFRQLFASSFINKYKIDWRYGATLFENYLIDYDVYSNWGNWQYLAGVGHDPRGLRFFNITKQLKRYDPHFEHIKHWTHYSNDLEISKVLNEIYPQF